MAAAPQRDKLVGRALDRGVTFFDTADGYAGGGVHLTSDDIAELDADTPLHRVYPNWYIDSLTDQPVSQALNAQ